MCKRWVDTAHLTSRAHINNLKYLRTLTQTEQQEQLKGWEDATTHTQRAKDMAREMEDWYVQEGSWQLCALCLQWEDMRHQNSRKHCQRVAYCQQLSDAERMVHIQQRLEMARDYLRAGAEDSPDKMALDAEA